MFSLTNQSMNISVSLGLKGKEKNEGFSSFLPARDEMSQAEFDARMLEGFTQAQMNLSAPADEVFSRLIHDIQNG